MLMGLVLREIFELTKAGKLAEALEVQHLTNDLITDILGNGLYSTLKELLEAQGVHAGYCRRPMASATDAQKAQAQVISLISISLSLIKSLYVIFHSINCRLSFFLSNHLAFYSAYTLPKI